MVATKLMTADDLAGLDEDLRVELIEGELAEMSPTDWTHLEVADALTDHLKAYARERTGLHVYMNDAGITLRRNPDTVLVPDIFVVTDEQRSIAKASKTAFPLIAPLIAIEVKSPSERESKIARKTALYLAGDVKEVWWIRPNERQITVHRQDAAPRTLEGDAVLESPELPGFRLPLADLFGA